MPGKQTSYAPVYKIVRWVPRPPALPAEGLPDMLGKKAAPRSGGTAPKPRPQVDDGMGDDVLF